MNYEALKEQVNDLFGVLLQYVANIDIYEENPEDLRECQFYIKPVKGKIPKFNITTYDQYEQTVSTEAVGLYQALVKHVEKLIRARWQVQNVDNEKFLDDAFMQIYQMVSVDSCDEEPLIVTVYRPGEEKFMILSQRVPVCDVGGILIPTDDSTCLMCLEECAQTFSGCFVQLLLDHAAPLRAYLEEFERAHIKDT